MIDALGRLGIVIHRSPTPERLCVVGCGGRIPAMEADLDVGNSGTTARFLTAVLTLAHGNYRLDGTPRMRQRPIEDLLQALRQLVRGRLPARDWLPAGSGSRPRLAGRTGHRGRRTVEPVPQRAAAGRALCRERRGDRRRGRFGLSALCRDDAGRDGLIRRRGENAGAGPILCGRATAVSRAAILDRARRHAASHAPKIIPRCPFLPPAKEGPIIAGSSAHCCSWPRRSSTSIARSSESSDRG